MFVGFQHTFYRRTLLSSAYRARVIEINERHPNAKKIVDDRWIFWMKANAWSIHVNSRNMDKQAAVRDHGRTPLWRKGHQSLCSHHQKWTWNVPSAPLLSNKDVMKNKHHQTSISFKNREGDAQIWQAVANIPVSSQLLHKLLQTADDTTVASITHCNALKLLSQTCRVTRVLVHVP